MPYFTRTVFAAGAALGLTITGASHAQAKVKIAVDLDAQTMHVEAGTKQFDWKVSSGKPGYETPAGKFGVLWMDKDHHSDTYEQAFMPNAIFFAPGYAIHGFGKSPWGHKASHGCIRLPAAKAAVLFDMVKAEGAEVTISGESPVVAPTVASVEAKARQAAATAVPDAQGDAQAYDQPGYSEAPVDARPTHQTPADALFSGFY